MESGHAAIDRQHKLLINEVNVLSDAHKSGKGQENVAQTLEFLEAYTIKHFADEEKLQVKYNYPEYPEHKRLHDEFTIVVQGLVATVAKDGPTDEFITTLSITVGEWLFNHIRGEDFKMAAYVKAAQRQAGEA